MEEVLHGVLSTLAEYSNVCSISVIIVSCTCMVIFIMRLSTDHFATRIETQPGSYIPAQAMRDVHNPFVFKLRTDKSSNFTDGARFELTSQVPCVIQAFWGVNIQKVYPAVFQPWLDFNRRFSEGTLFDEILMAKQDQIILWDNCEKKNLHFTSPKIANGEPLDLGTPPRPCYPLVVVIVNTLDSTLTDDLSVMCMVSFIHLSDELCPGSSHIISQYVRTAHGQPYSLQQLYVATTEPEPMQSDTDTHTDTPLTPPQPSSSHNSDAKSSSDNLNLSSEHEEDPPPDGGCIVCQTQQISRAFLPCRHACVCDDCFLRLEKCPMCRSGIESYFRLDGQLEDWMVEDEEEQDWWTRLNHNINHTLGQFFNAT